MNLVTDPSAGPKSLPAHYLNHFTTAFESRPVAAKKPRPFGFFSPSNARFLLCREAAVDPRRPCDARKAPELLRRNQCSSRTCVSGLEPARGTNAKATRDAALPSDRGHSGQHFLIWAMARRSASYPACSASAAASDGRRC